MKLLFIVNNSVNKLLISFNVFSSRFNQCLMSIGRYYPVYAGFISKVKYKIYVNYKLVIEH